MLRSPIDLAYDRPRAFTFLRLALVATLALVAAIACEGNDPKIGPSPAGDPAPAPAAQSGEPAMTPPTAADAGQVTTATASATGGMMAQVESNCPMIVQGATVAASDTADGIALTFTTTGSDVADLRTRVGHMAEMYGLHGGGQGMMWHHMAVRGGGPGTMGAPGMGQGGPGAGIATGRAMMPAATATTEEIEGGARILLVPTTPTDLEALREQARMHLVRMQSGDCPMMGPERR